MARIGPYELLERIGVGGMAEVFKARQAGEEGFERTVAVKRILPNIAADPDFVRMFIDEAKIAVQLQHPNIAQIYDLGRDVDELFIALEYIEGRDMKAIGARQEQMGRHLPLSFVIQVVAKICEALNHAHFARGSSGAPLNFIHRDISPQNILISHEGAVKVIDFGLAKAAGRLVTTQAGVVKGKLAYLSAEQARGESIDHRSDIFSLGTCLYEWLTGERLFLRKNDADTVISVQKAMVPPLRALRPELPLELQTIVRRALQSNPDQRYQTAAEMQEELMAFAVDAGIPMRRRNISAHMMLLFPEDQKAPAKVSRRETIRSSGRSSGPRSHEMQSLLDMVPESAPKPLHQEATRTHRTPSVEELSLVDVLDVDDPFSFQEEDVVAVPVVEHDSSSLGPPTLDPSDWEGDATRALLASEVSFSPPTTSSSDWEDDATRALLASEVSFDPPAPDPNDWDDATRALQASEASFEEETPAVVGDMRFEEVTRAVLSSEVLSPDVSTGEHAPAPTNPNAPMFDDRTTGSFDIAEERAARSGLADLDSDGESTVQYSREILHRVLGRPEESEPLQPSFSSLSFVDATDDGSPVEFDELPSDELPDEEPILGDATQPSIEVPPFTGPDDES